ncbi:MAG: hypothetical protein HGJ94_20805 [Desulfosarcina sp.]|nr:hypothetical protein [Desulfosarcina sp.]MBC2741954.1 hypothetical protein [Desulfosarcina sp.]MBC2764867.1 hypothetical protein [Desulfosarcina sp.]
MAAPKNQSNPILVIICAFGLLAFLLVVIYPNYRTISEYDRQISALNGEIALRQAIAPIYGKLVEKARITPSTQLKSPKKTALDMEKAGRLTQIFQDIAKTAGLTLESVIPDAQAFDQNTGRLLVDVVFRGDFLNVQPLINTIGEQSFVDRLQKIQVRTAKENKWIKLSVSLLHR